MAHEPTNSSNAPIRGGGATLLHRSCHECNRRKVRCNKTDPCGNCVRFGVACTFPPPGRKARKPPKSASNKAELISRLSRLEGEFEKLGQSQPEATSVDLPEEQDRHPSGGSSRNVHPLLAKDLAADVLAEAEDEMPGSQKANSTSLEDQFGRLVVDRNNGTTQYVNHRVLADLANQVNSVWTTLDGMRTSLLNLWCLA